MFNWTVIFGLGGTKPEPNFKVAECFGGKISANISNRAAWDYVSRSKKGRRIHDTSYATLLAVGCGFLVAKLLLRNLLRYRHPNHSVWKSQKKSHSTLRVKQATLHSKLATFWKPEAFGQTGHLNKGCNLQEQLSG